MLSVATLATLINVSMLLIIAVTERLLEAIIRVFVLSRLLRHHRAPNVRPTDFWLFNIPRSLIRFRHYPGIFCVFETTDPLFRTRLPHRKTSFEPRTDVPREVKLFFLHFSSLLLFLYLRRSPRADYLYRIHAVPCGKQGLPSRKGM